MTKILLSNLFGFKVSYINNKYFLKFLNIMNNYKKYYNYFINLFFIKISFRNHVFVIFLKYRKIVNENRNPKN